MLLFGITLLDVINVVLVLIFIALGWQYFGAKWSYKISKPWSWEEGMEQIDGTRYNKARSLARSGLA
jgi:hypothetical protein